MTHRVNNYTEMSLKRPSYTLSSQTDSSHSVDERFSQLDQRCKNPDYRMTSEDLLSMYTLCEEKIELYDALQQSGQYQGDANKMVFSKKDDKVVIAHQNGILKDHIHFNADQLPKELMPLDRLEKIVKSFDSHN